MTGVLVVDDSQFMRTVLSTVLSEHGYDVSTASDGESAIEAVTEEQPDVVTMDVEMPGMGGIEAVERIMEEQPTPILMLSAHTKEGADATLDALSRGAIDFIPKPSGEISTDIKQLEDELVETIDALVDADVDSVSTSRAADAVQTAADAEAAVIEASSSVQADASEAAGEQEAVGETPPVPPSYDGSPTVVIGASTGGPRVVERVLSELPAALNARVLVVQHMPASFTDRLSRRLDDFSEYDVREAADGARVTAGEVLVARGEYHMEVSYAGPEHCKVRLTEADRLHGVRPAIDVTMCSAAREVDGDLIGVALTGMGRDGAEGIAAIKHAGGATIAQDEETAPVYGIPKQAVETGAVDRVLPDEEIASGVVDLAVELATTRRVEVEPDG